MRSRRCFGPAECASTGRYPSSDPRHRASRHRRPATETDPCSFETPDAIANFGCLLELLAVDGATQPLAQLAEHRRAVERLARRNIARRDEAARPRCP